MTAASWLFSKAAAISHSVAEATMFLSVSHRALVGPFNFGFAVDVSLMKSLRKQWPQNLLLALGSTRHAPSLCTHSTMSDVFG